MDSNVRSVKTTTPSTIIPLSEIPVHKVNSNHNHHHLSPHDQSHHTSKSPNHLYASTLSFRNVTYVLGDTRADHLYRKWYPSCLKPEPPKMILNNVSGIFNSGMNAIMGKSLLYSSCMRNISTY